ncbi:hypothetical protein M501DRAFT_931893 [Patellaria atrata CBS 101060]|uniref:EthD domain-containing protein n=1 Tax=Patellaria atrata CBS 101060 TaxID=1346257 RepID=A0A9P4VQX6_9PEZI|nr:hypothetical protein M501DRAFT_931893 [Patellaria atrata CBS 101060]
MSEACIKLSFFFNKLPDVSYEHFYKHYGHVHADLTVGTKAFGQFNIQRYTQHHATPEMREKLRSIGMSVLDWDACSTLWVKSWEDAERFFGSPEYSKLADDCKHFMDTSNGIPCMAG